MRFVEGQCRQEEMELEKTAGEPARSAVMLEDRLRRQNENFSRWIEIVRERLMEGAGFIATLNC
ncbi:MAG: hypothetical protein WBW16_13465 [Bacteroidota bacterium]